MKKMVIALISILALLAACTNGSEEAAAGNAEKEFGTAPIEDDKEESEREDSAKEKDEKTKNDKEIADFPEYDVLAEEITVDDLDVDIKANNSNKRVMLLSDDNGKKQYKSIFIKEKKRLKIISLDDDGQIFNDVI